MEKQNMENKNIEKLLMSLLMSQGISATTIAKIMGVDKATISRTIPVSEIQNDCKKYDKKYNTQDTYSGRKVIQGHSGTLCSSCKTGRYE